MGRFYLRFCFHNDGPTIFGWVIGNKPAPAQSSNRKQLPVQKINSPKGRMAIKNTEIQYTGRQMQRFHCKTGSVRRQA